MLFEGIFTGRKLSNTVAFLQCQFTAQLVKADLVLDEVESHPVKECTKGRILQNVGDIFLHISCSRTNLCEFLVAVVVPHSIHSFLTFFIVSGNEWPEQGHMCY